MTHRPVPVETLETLAGALLEGVGTPPGLAGEVAESLIQSDLRGHHSHGVMRVPWYRRMIDADRIEPGAEPDIGGEGAVRRVDGNTAFGQIVGRRSVDALVEAVDEQGVAAAGIRDGAHLGRVGEWAERAAAEGVILAAFVCGGGSNALVAAPGTADKVISTNPIAIGIPTFDARPFDVVLDVATSQVANGKLRERLATGEPIPDEWTISESGAPVTDPEAYFAGEGALLPLGGLVSGYKGFGFGVVAELLAGVLGDWFVQGQRSIDWPNSAAAFIGIDPLAFADRSSIEDRIAAFASHLGAVEAAPAIPESPGAMPGVGMLPGEPEYHATQEQLEAGIPVPDRVATDLVELARETGHEDAVPAALR